MLKEAYKQTTDRELRVMRLCEEAARIMWRPSPNLHLAEHALREALQIIETLKEGESK